MAERSVTLHVWLSFAESIIHGEKGRTGIGENRLHWCFPLCENDARVAFIVNAPLQRAIITVGPQSVKEAMIISVDVIVYF